MAIPPGSSCNHASCGPEGVLTLAGSVTGLLAFSSRVVPLLIYATTSDQPKEPRRVIRLRDEILEVMASLEILQQYLITSSRHPIKLESLLAILAEIVTIYSEFEKLLSKSRGRASKLVLKFEGIFLRRKILSVTQRLRYYRWLLDMILDILQGFNPPEYDKASESWTSIDPEEQAYGWNALIEAKLKCKECLEGWGLCRKCQKVKSSLTAAHDLAKASPMIDLSYYAEFSLPISLDEVFNSVWYSSPADKTLSKEDLMVEKLLREAAAMSKRSLPLPGSPTFPCGIVCRPSKKVQRKINSNIERYLQNLHQKEAGEKEVVMFGFTDIVSSCFDSLKIDAKWPQSNKERYLFLLLAFNYLLRGLELAVRKVERDGGFDNAEDKAWAILLCLIPDVAQPSCLPISCLPIFTKLWSSSKVQLAIRDAESQYPYEVLQHFFHDIHRLFNKTYVPTNQDIHIISPPPKRRNIEEFDFQVKLHKYRLLHLLSCDQRRKWIHILNNPDVVFVVDISTFDQPLFEDPAGHVGTTQTCMTQNLVLFESITSSGWFMDAKIVLLFLDIDRFRAKIGDGAGMEARKMYPTFEGQETDAEDWLQFFTDLFISVTRKAGKQRAGVSVEYTWENDRKVLEKIDRCLRMDCDG